MKNVIYNLYNILLDEIKREGNNYHFYFNSDLYLFYLVENDIELVKKIYSFVKENKIECYEIISNKNNQLFTKIENKVYSLLKIKGILKYEVNFQEFKYYPFKGVFNNWGKLWNDRLDYYEIQIRELGFNYQTVLNSYGLFSGIATNAILYYNMSIKNFNDEIITGIVHNRMKYPTYLIDYNNPINFIIDYNIRDIAEYIKAYFMSNDYEEENVIMLLNRLQVNTLMFNLLYSRLLYPTFYFDIFDKILLDDGKDNDVILVVNKFDEYIRLLQVIYYKFKDKYNMFNINWINKNVEN